MAYPVLMAVGVAASAAAAGMQAAAAADAQRAMKNAVDSELQRQRGYQKEGSKILAESMSKSTRESADTSLEESQQRRETAYQDVEKRKLSDYVPQDKAVSEEQKTGTKMRQEQSDVARAALMSWGDWETQQYVKDLQAASKLNIMTGLSRGSADVMPLEIGDAQNAGEGWETAGAVTRGAGQIAGMAGAIQKPSQYGYGASGFQRLSKQDKFDLGVS